MFALDLCARFARLLDDKVRGVLFDHRFDVGPLVAWNEYEALDLGCDPIVLGRRKFDLLETTFIAALAMERQRLVDAVLFGTFLNPLIDGAKQFLVMCGSVREGHKPILPQYAQETSFRLPAPLARSGCKAASLPQGCWLSLTTFPLWLSRRTGRSRLSGRARCRPGMPALARLVMAQRENVAGADPARAPFLPLID